MRTSRGRHARPPRIAAGLAGLALLTLTACGSPSTPGAPVESPAAPVETAAPTVAETAESTPAASPDATATPDGTASPNASASPDGTATPAQTASPTPSIQALMLPNRVESFQRVEQRSENDVRIGSYYSETLKTVIEVRMSSEQPAREFVTSLGGADATNVGEALCSTGGDSICAREQNGITVAVISKELPATMVGDLTSKVLTAN